MWSYEQENNIINFPLVLIGCSLKNEIDPYKYIYDNLSIDVSSCELIDYDSSYFSPLGDGQRYISFDCIGNDIVDSISDWSVFPLSDNLNKAIYGIETKTSSGKGLCGQYNCPKIENGYYYFYNRHRNATDVKSDEDLYDLGSRNFTFAMYDIENTRLYYIEFDS